MLNNVNDMIKIMIYIEFDICQNSIIFNISFISYSIYSYAYMNKSFSFASSITYANEFFSIKHL